MQAGAATITERVRQVARLEGPARSTTPPLPHSAKIELTARCDFGCFFCASQARPRTRSDMPWELYTRLAHELRAAGVNQVGLFYLGESLLCSWLADAVRYARKECGFPYVFITTNGQRATPARVRELMLAGLDSLKFSCNWADPGQLHQMSGAAPETFDAIVEHIIAARRIRDEIRTQTGHHCALYASSLLYDQQQQERMAPALARILPHVDEHYWLPLLGYPAPRSIGHGAVDPCAPQVKVKPLPCWGLFTEAHITADGRVSACCLDHSPRFEMGDLTHSPFTKVWHAPAFQNLRAAHLAGDVSTTACSNCIGYHTPRNGQ